MVTISTSRWHALLRGPGRGELLERGRVLAVVPEAIVDRGGEEFARARFRLGPIRSMLDLIPTWPASATSI